MLSRYMSNVIALYDTAQPDHQSDDGNCTRAKMFFPDSTSNLNLWSIAQFLFGNTWDCLRV